MASARKRGVNHAFGMHRLSIRKLTQRLNHNFLSSALPRLPKPPGLTSLRQVLKLPALLQALKQ
jgi:hypothetical protein